MQRYSETKRGGEHAGLEFEELFLRRDIPLELKELRAKFDGIDDKIIELFVQRMKTSGQIAAVKRKNGLAILNSSREREVLDHVMDRAGDGMELYAKLLYQTMFEVSRSDQHWLLDDTSEFMHEIRAAAERTPALFPQKGVVACQGVEGAYSQQACDKLFAMPRIMYFRHFDGVFQAVQSGMCKYGILPIENSSYGSVAQVYDLMRNHKFYIVRSIKLCVRHALLAKHGVRLQDVKEVFSHEQAIGQCSAYLKAHPEIKITICENTAVAARMVAESDRKDIAAISSVHCAQLYGLHVLEERVQNNDNNYTRFICISKDLEIYPGANKISLMLSARDRPGALYSVLAKFAALGVNLTKLESRPLPGSDFEFIFYFDMEASVLSDAVLKMLSELMAEPDVFVFLGNYAEVV